MYTKLQAVSMNWPVELESMDRKLPRSQQPLCLSDGFTFTVCMHSGRPVTNSRRQVRSTSVYAESARATRFSRQLVEREMCRCRRVGSVEYVVGDGRDECASRIGLFSKMTTAWRKQRNLETLFLLVVVCVWYSESCGSNGIG